MSTRNILPTYASACVCVWERESSCASVCLQLIIAVNKSQEASFLVTASIQEIRDFLPRYLTLSLTLTQVHTHWFFLFVNVLIMSIEHLIKQTRDGEITLN